MFAASDNPNILVSFTASAALFTSHGSFAALAVCCPELQELLILEDMQFDEEYCQYVMDTQVSLTWRIAMVAFAYSIVGA